MLGVMHKGWSVLVVVLVGCSSTGTGLPDPLGDSGVPVDAAPGEDAGADGAPAAACAMAGDSCSGKADACCNGTTCVYDVDAPAKSVCAATCLKDANCKSGCCTVLISGSSAVCAPARYCAAACAKPGADCTATPCCADGICTVSGGTTLCAARCTSSAACASGCCAPLDNTGELVCSPPQFCN